MSTSYDTRALVEHRIGRDGELTLRLHAGSVEIRATEGDLARVRDLDGRDLAERFVVDREAGRLSVRPRDRLLLDLPFAGRGRAPARLAVEVPGSARASLDTASGDVRAIGLTGDQRYRSASGSIALDDVSGSIALDSVSGSVDIRAAGAVELTGRLVSGDVRLSGGTLQAVSLSTTSGDVRLEAPLDGPGPYGVQTVSGEALVVAGEGGLRVDARTVTGWLASDPPGQSKSAPGQRSLVVGEGRVRLEFQSISGGIRVRSVTSDPRAAVPPAPRAAEADRAGGDGQARRLAILRDLEAGAIDVDTATRRLADLEEPIDA